MQWVLFCTIELGDVLEGGGNGMPYLFGLVDNEIDAVRLVNDHIKTTSDYHDLDHSPFVYMSPVDEEAARELGMWMNGSVDVEYLERFGIDVTNERYNMYRMKEEAR